MDVTFAEMIATLQEAHSILEERFDALSEAEIWDVSELAKLLMAARTLAGQADSLLAIMLDRNVADAALAEVKDLRASFNDLNNRITVNLGMNKE